MPKPCLCANLSHNLTSRAQAYTQEFEEERCRAVEFMDDHRLLVSLESRQDAPSSLVLMDTGKFVGGVPVQTSLRLSRHFDSFGIQPLRLERGMHKPSPAESLVPFYNDPAQRIIVLETQSYLVLCVGLLLEILESRGGSEVGWDEWKRHVFTPSTSHIQESHQVALTAEAWVSGCRLFLSYSVGPGQDFQMEVYNFTHRSEGTGPKWCVRWNAQHP